MYQPKITFITATFNSEKTLEQTISSILDQTYHDIEYIVIDGGSTDGTIDILKKYGDQIRWISESDNGICDAVGKGIDFSTGDYINILGSDDSLFSPYIVDAVVEQLQDRPDLLACNKYSVDEDTLFQYPACHTDRMRNGLFCIPTEGAYIGRHVLEKYSYDRNLKLLADYKLFIQCQLDKSIRIKYSELYTAFFSTSGASSSPVMSEIDMVKVDKELHIDPRKYYGDESQARGGVCIKKIIRNRLPFPVRLFALFVKRKVEQCIFNAFPISLYVAYLRSQHPNIVPHKCDNKICRWCHRAGR